MNDKQACFEEIMTVETRGLVDSFEGVKERLDSLGAIPGEVEKIVDEHYADLTEATPHRHTYEKTGKAARVRLRIVPGETRIEAVVKEGLRKTARGIFSHNLVGSKIVFRGKVSEIDRARKLVKSQGFPKLILVVKKTREIDAFDGMTIYLESIENFGPAIEIRTEIRNKSQLSGVKENQVNFLKELGLGEGDILEDSHTHILVSARIATDPKIKIPYLQRELERLEKKLEEKMRASNLEYCEAGDGWHDNPGWDSLMAEADLLRARIREVKQELSRTKGPG